MKITRSIRDLYDAQLELNGRLKDLVDEKMRGIKEARWHYESRVKELQSFALKIETGRFPKPAELEDFFACTLVVANTSEIARALEVITSQFELLYRRPEHSDKTITRPESFPFDDLRLYAKLRDDPALPPNAYANIIFEIQIKTFLQHAWSIATHDLIYKADDVVWSKARIAYQIRAMLEHAEVSIQEAEVLAASPSVAKEDMSATSIRENITLLKNHWKAEDLPKNLRLLSEIITKLLKNITNMTSARLGEILDLEKTRLGGALPLNLSPYATIVQALLFHEKDATQKLLTSNKASARVVISAEVDFPEDIDKGKCVNVTFIT